MEEIFEIQSPLGRLRKMQSIVSHVKSDVTKIVEGCVHKDLPQADKDHILQSEVSNAQVFAKPVEDQLKQVQLKFQRLGSKCDGTKAKIIESVLRDFGMFFSLCLDPSNVRSRVLTSMRNRCPDIIPATVNEVIQNATENNDWVESCVPHIIWRSGNGWRDEKLDLFHTTQKLWYSIPRDDVFKWWNIKESVPLPADSIEAKLLACDALGLDKHTSPDDAFTPMLAPAHSDLKKIQYTTSSEPFMTNVGEVVNPSDVVVVAEDKADTRAFKISEMHTGRWMNELLPVSRVQFEQIRKCFPTLLGARP